MEIAALLLVTTYVVASTALPLEEKRPGPFPGKSPSDLVATKRNNIIVPARTFSNPLQTEVINDPAPYLVKVPSSIIVVRQPTILLQPFVQGVNTADDARPSISQHQQRFPYDDVFSIQYPIYPIGILEGFGGFPPISPGIQVIPLEGNLYIEEPTKLPSIEESDDSDSVTVEALDLYKKYLKHNS
ncbi:uncharacterized protein LOC115883647 [Sitophilus oryzae]|uniref:Uncharacterized protein LOC115883647 n=1 Tax=Sitophilus oryzae TaxID=7048 RepID=A0A6J2Y3P8_SITOR|nr:uncharacterized protein LOC115883647 [Sitophilus oryzae]